jgi:hypothetical protein
MTNQVFGSALRQPWALVVFGSNAPTGKRPATTVAYLTDDEGTHYLGGLVEHYRRSARHVKGVLIAGDPSARWHYRFRYNKRIPKEDVLHIFLSTIKNAWGGPSMSQIRAARKALPVTAS